jgi:polysaccharide export outer membrane protein
MVGTACLASLVIGCVSGRRECAPSNAPAEAQHGCFWWGDQPAPGAGEQFPVPKELKKANHPAYTIEPPDVLRIDALRLVPKPPYHIEPMDALLIRATGVFESDPISGIFLVDPDGSINLGDKYGTVEVAGLTLRKAQDAIYAQLKKTVNKPRVTTVSLAQSKLLQLIRGDHLVRQDGTISMGNYGGVNVTNMTVEEARRAIQNHLKQFLVNPEISLDISGYNSKVYYVVMNLAAGEHIVRLPITGNETVLDALAQLSGLPPTSSKKRIWVSRPAPEGRPDQVLPVDYLAVTRGGSTKTNYQLFPGDRVFVEADPLISLDNFVAKVFAPLERAFGVTLLGTAAIHTLQGSNRNGSTGGTGIGGGF